MVGLTKFSVTNRVLVALLSAVVLIFGLVAVSSMRVELFPSMSPPTAQIFASYPGGSPEVMSQEVAAPIESSLESLEGLDGVTSTSTHGLAVIDVDFEVDADAEGSIDGVRQRVNEASGQTPDGTEIEVMDLGGGDDTDFVLALSAAADEDPGALASNLHELVVPELEALPGVRQVDVWGEQRQYVDISPDEDDLEDEGLVVSDVAATLEASGLLHPGGGLTVDGQTLSITVGQEYEDLEVLEDLHMLPHAVPTAEDPEPEPDAVRLGDVAEISMAAEEEESYTRGNGADSVSISVYKEREANLVDVSHQVHALLPKLADDLGDGGELFPTVETAPFIEDSVDGLVNEGLIGLVVVGALIMLFLMSVRTTLVTLVSIPLSLLGSLIVLWLSGYTLNILTLAGLTAAIGRVVDDSIVVLENIKRHLSYGGERLRTIIAAVRQVAGAITSSTLVTAGVFLPLAFIGGELGMLFQPFGIAMAVALLVSLVVSLTVVPLFSYWFLKQETAQGEDREEAARQAHEREQRSWLQRAYAPILRFAVGRSARGWRTWRRWFVLGTALTIFFASILLATGLRFVFLEDSGQNQLSINQELPAGSALEVTDEAATEIEEVLDGVDEVVSYETTVGSDGSVAASHAANFWVTVDPESDVAEVRADVQDRLSELDGVGELAVGTLFQSGDASGNQVEVELRSDDSDDLAEASDAVVELMEGIDRAGDVSSDLETVVPGIEVTPVPDRAAEEEIDASQLAWLVESALNGMNAGNILISGTERAVVIDTGDAPGDIEELRDLEISGARGTLRLEQVADVEEVERPASVTHTEGERSAVVSAEGALVDLPLIADEVNTGVGDLDLPNGVSYSIVGDSEAQEEAQTDMGVVLLTSLAIVFVLLVGTFRSLAQPLILLVAVPLAVSGSVTALYLTDTAMSMSAGIGMLMLIGIVVTNAILLTDLTNQYRSDGLSLTEAVTKGARHRLRPILMTSLATMGALVPMALGLGSGSVFIAQALSIVVIGGLLSSTLLTLIVVPTLYIMVEEGKERRRDRRVRRRRRRELARTTAHDRSGGGGDAGSGKSSDDGDDNGSGKSSDDGGDAGSGKSSDDGGDAGSGKSSDDGDDNGPEKSSDDGGRTES